MGTCSRLAGERDVQPCYQPSPLPTEAVKLAALTAWFPEFVFFVTFVRGRRYYQAERVRGDGPLPLVASASTIDLRRILNRAHGLPGLGGFRTRQGRTRHP